MKTDEKKFASIFLRYGILVLIAITGLNLFYYLFLPLTKYPIYYFTDLLYDKVLLSESIIFVGKKSIELVEACIAGSAYFLLLILNLSIPDLKIKKRINLLLFTFGTFLLINLIRIQVLTIMYLNNSPFFELAHKLFWYLGSTIFVVLIWFLGIKIFKIKKIPFYHDLKYMYSKSSLKKKNSKRR